MALDLKKSNNLPPNNNYEEGDILDDNAKENNLKYNGFVGSIEYSKEDGLFFGKVQDIRSLVSYEGQTIEELEKDFREAVDDFLEMCEELGLEAR